MENVEAIDPEDFFSAAVQCSPDSISVSRLEDGSFLQVNDAFLDMTGYRREEVIGKNSRELRIWTEEGERERFLALLSQSGRVRDLDVRFGMKDGDIRNVQISAAIVRIGGKDCITAACRDVTSLRAMFERLEKGSFLLERAEEMADIGSWEFDYATGRVTGSPGARRIYGLDEGEFSVEAVETVPLQQYRSMLDQARDALINDGIPYDIEFEIRAQERRRHPRRPLEGALGPRQQAALRHHQGHHGGEGDRGGAQARPRREGDPHQGALPPHQEQHAGDLSLLGIEGIGRTSRGCARFSRKCSGGSTPWPSSTRCSTSRATSRASGSGTSSVPSSSC